MTAPRPAVDMDLLRQQGRRAARRGEIDLSGDRPGPGIDFWKRVMRSDPATAEKAPDGSDTEHDRR